jgi:hypothetical protein
MMKRLAVSTTVAGLLALGTTGALTLAPSAGATSSFLHNGAHATVAREVVPGARITPGSVWTLTVAGGGCNVWTFASSGNGVVIDSGFSGTYSKPTVNEVKAKFPTDPAKYKGTYAHGIYTGTFVVVGLVFPGATLTPGATPDC